MNSKNKWTLPLILFAFAGVFGAGCAGIQPPVRRASDEQFEKGLTYSEQEFQKPIDILQGEWTPADSSAVQSKLESFPAEVQGNYFIQIISLSTKSQAQKFVQRMKKANPRVRFFIRKRGNYWAVWVGRFQKRKDARAALNSNWAKKFPDAWIVHEKLNK